MSTPLIFVIPDNILSDNTGGVSVLISPTILRVNLNIGLSGNSVVLQWPTNASGFTLAQKTNLQNGAWSDVPQSPLVVNTNFSVTLPRDLSTNRFFILHNP